MVVLTFSVLKRKPLFWINLVQNIKIASLSRNLLPRVIWGCRIQWWFSLFFVFDWNSPFWANLVQKTKIVSLSWNLAPRPMRISRIRWCFKTWENSIQKNKNYQFKLKFCTKFNTNIWNSMVILVGFVGCCLRPEILFWGKLLQKIKIV